jgi:putative PIG3 family NAD(P)H quinone oxidoreductase
MRAIVIARPGGPEVLEQRDVPAPAPAAGEVLVRVRAAALNRADLLQRRGAYPAPAGSPADVPGLEYAGEVAALGAGVRGLREGDRVMGLVGGGAYAEYVTAHERTAVPVPAGLGWAEAAAVPEAFMTAHDALAQAGARPGEAALVHAAASGVGLAAVQLARALGLRALGTTRTAAKVAAVRAHGAGAVLLVPPEAAADEPALRALLGAFVRGHAGAGADVALDLAGGPYVNATLHAMAERGRVVLVGLVAGRSGAVDFGRVLAGRLTLRGTVMRSRPLEERIATARRFAAEVVPWLADATVRPTVDRVLPLAAAADAHRALEGDATTGKVVLSVA